jgi:steroid delta-isomerase-like uncharacterized protein
MNTTQLEAYMNELVDVFNRHEADAFAAFYTQDATAYDPQYAEQLKGRDAIKKDIEDFFMALPDVRAKVLSSVAGGDTIAFEVEMTGTHDGPLVTPDGHVPPTNRPVKFLGSRVIRFNSQGQITSCNRYYDLAGIMQQLGLLE